MTEYKCGHEIDCVIMNNSILGLSEWIEWKNTVGFDGDKSQCWDCYCKSQEKKERN